VRLTPKAGRDGIAGLKPTVDGGVELTAKVTAVPENGKANDALLRLLSKSLKLPVSAFTLVAGATDRHKQILISGDPAAIETALVSLIAALKQKE
jgi:uncharacterized protein YggU (UPF0235/DUF167 family)